MKNKEKGSFSMIKIICISVLMIALLGIGVFAVNRNLNDIVIILDNGYEMKVFTGKTKVSEILNENNIVLKENQKTSIDMETDIKSGDVIKILDKSEENINTTVISEKVVETTLDDLLQNYSVVTEKIIVEQVVIPFETITKNSEVAGKTRNRTLQNGKDGLKKITYKVKYQNDTEIEKVVISEVIIKEKVDKIVEVQKVTSRSSTTVRTATGTAGEYQAYAKEYISSTYGWGEDQFAALIKLWNKESGWNANAHNPNSGAHGIAQALPASKMASSGADYYTNGETQIRWGVKYIASRYGSPINAWNHSVQKNWY